MATEQTNKEFARRWNEEIWGQQNVDAIDDLVAEDFVGHDPSRPEPVRGPDGVRAVVEMLFSAFPDTQVDLEEVVAEGDRIAMRITASGTHEGEFMGIEPTGEEMEVSVMTFQRIEDGKAVEEWQIVDTLGMLQQLGVIELPGE
jgi:steroid delta-isomerase-like uncharacterized protein